MQGGFHHGVDAGKNTIDSDRIFIIYLTFSLAFSGSFVHHFVNVHAFVRSSDDIEVKALRSIRKCSGLALDLCLAIQLAHPHQQYQANASIEASFLDINADEWRCIFVAATVE